MLFDTPFFALSRPEVVSTLQEAGWKSFLVLALAGLAAFGLRRASAATRHLVWFGAMIGLLFLPLLCAALPHWRVLPWWVRHTSLPPLTELNVPAQSLPVTRAGVPVENPSKTHAWTKSTAGAGIAAKPRPLRAEPGLGKTVQLRFARWFVVAWLSGVFLILCARVLGVLSLWRLGRRSERVTEPAWLRLLHEATGLSPTETHAVLLRTSRRRMPMTWGVFRPKVLLPQEALEWPRERLRGVLLHEFAHVERRDYLTNLLAQFVCALYWFNPFAWMAARNMFAERERACDDIVLQGGIEPASYAEQLLEFAAGVPAGGLEACSALLMTRRSLLEGRLLAILDEARSRTPVTPAGFFVAVSVLLGCLTCVAMASARTETAKPAASQGPGGFSKGSAAELVARLLSLSPVIERALPCEKVGGGTAYLHFQRGEVVVAPPDPVPPERLVTNVWMSRDVTVARSSAGLELRGRGCAFAAVDARRWDTVPPETVVSELSAEGLPDHVTVPDAGAAPAVYLFQTRENTQGILQVARVLDSPANPFTATGAPQAGPSDRVAIRYKLVQPEAHPGLGSRRVSSPLINVVFGLADESPKAGPAAVGQKPDDFWNAVNCADERGVIRSGGMAQGLKLADGAPTAAWLVFDNAAGHFANGSDDIMYHGIMYDPNGGSVTVAFHDLAPGTYEFYIYTHDGNDLIEAGGVTYPPAGPARSFEWPVRNPVVWTEGRQFVVIRGVQVAAGQPVTLKALAGRQGVALLSGMQILKVD